MILLVFGVCKGSSKRREQMQAKKLRQVAGHWLVIPPWSSMCARPSQSRRSSKGLIAGLSFIGSTELVHLLPRLFLGMLLSFAGSGVVVGSLWGSSG